MKTGIARFARSAAGVVAILAASVLVCYAQQIWSGGYGYTPPRFPTPTSFNGSFNFCRALFRSDRREKSGWSTDYPDASSLFASGRGVLATGTGKMRIRAAGVEAPDAVVIRLTVVSR